MNLNLDLQCINTIRFLAVDAMQKAKSGHPGLPLGAASMAHVLWTRFLRHNPVNPQWFDRDRFVLSAGHGSTLGWIRYVGDYGDVIGIDRFGASAPGPVMMREYGFTVDNICERAAILLERGSHA